MTTDRCVKWNTKAQEFFSSSSDYSLELIFVVSHRCDSQTGEGFEELINSINSENIKRKIKKLTILDASFLYRYCSSWFNSLADKSVPSIWFVNNKDYISKLQVNVAIDSWIDHINSEAFNYWHDKLTVDFTGDENGNNIALEFRDTLNTEAAISHYKGNGSFEACRDFLMEESAHACAFLNNKSVIYPMDLADSLLCAAKLHGITIRHLKYKISVQAQSNYKHNPLDREKVDKEISSFMKEKVSSVNFFVIDKYGNYIYKNNAFSRIVGNINAEDLDPNSWKVSKEVMKEGIQKIVEEEYKGTYYLSIKSPMVIDGEIEGIIGLAIDITDRKKAQKLEQQNNLKIIYEQIAHDIRSPLTTLSMLTRNCKGLSEKEHIALRNVATSIENITSDLLNKYKEDKRLESIDDKYISIYISLLEILNNKRCQYRDLSVIFNFSSDPSDNFVFIRGDYSDFCRMISNLLNNSVEAFEGKSGVIEVSFTAKNQKVEISIKDNGKGMPQEMVDKFMQNIPVGTTKQDGYGIGMQQVKSTLEQMNGQMLIESVENIGTEITLTFPESEPPVWVTGQIVLHKGETVVVLDNDPSIHSVWENRLKKYSGDITAKYFTQGSEVIDYINSFKEKNKILLLTDYELRNQDINGIDVIEKTNMQKRSILVTSVYTYKIENFSEKAKFIKMLSKLYMNEIPIVMEKDRKTETADFVFIDDNKVLTQSLSDFFESRGLRVHTYNSPDAFLENLSQYSKDTKIAIDNELNSGISGLELAKQLHEQGYVNLYLFSGIAFNENEVPPYLTVILKGNEDFMEKLL